MSILHLPSGHINLTVGCSSLLGIQPSGSPCIYLVLFQSYLPLLLAANECPDTSVNLLIMLHSLNEVSRKKSSSVINFSLWRKCVDRRKLLTAVALMQAQY